MIRQADPAAVNDVRKIGEVLGEATSEGTWERVTEVENILVIDVGGDNSKEALGKAKHLLGKRGWREISQRSPKWLIMESTVWKDVHLSINEFDPIKVETYPEEIGRAIERGKVESESLIFVHVYQV
ncbi:hypothetical protein FHS43_003003 [Streptosporangium becharense]|uniref:Uncharacterized protein n=1 Tax=Streptosporangium becharense TaxID=1816182 RepID=A0A7W9IKP9_9ACTN|nr:hypothetical protein [Streptosporangium becharense]MBB2911730.1 hypothetical protein [Streptosporangium becharense]MBB5822452.1 hypothetical protein [Streptosporangium becharense]